MLNHYDLFAIRITQTKFPLQIDLYKKITDFVDKNYVAKDGNKMSNWFGYQEHEDFDGKKELDEQLEQFFQMHFNCTIQHGWLNALEGRAYNQPHSHTGDMSAVLYLSKDNNNITFARDNLTQEFKPNLFDLLIFPAELIHYVLPTENTQRRISYALNLGRRKK